MIPRPQYKPADNAALRHADFRDYTKAVVASAKLRDSIALLAQRDGKFTAQTKRHAAARKAIAKGIAREEVMSLFDLSATAYDDLAGQVKAGLVE